MEACVYVYMYLSQYAYECKSVRISILFVYKVFSNSSYIHYRSEYCSWYWDFDDEAIAYDTASLLAVR